MRARRIIGNSTQRLEGPEKVSGRAIYAADVVLPNMLWAKVLRSPISYGRIKRIDTRKALALPGVHAVATGEDVKGLLIGRKIYDMPILADGVVRFIGERVAAVAAESEAVAEAAVDLIEVEYEEMEPLLDPLQAIGPATTLLHPEVQSYRGLLHPIEKASNVFVDMTWKKGDLEAGFRESDIIVENIFTTKPVHQAYIEPHSCVVQANDSSGAEVWACSKVPFALREQVATSLGKAVDKFVMHPCYIGGCFGGKGDFMDVAVCTVLSQKSGRPVKRIMDYSEEFVAGNPRHAAIVKVKTGVAQGGRLLAHQMEYIFDSGAYAAFKPQGYLVGPKEAAGPYNIPHVFIRERIVYTNKIPCGHMRAPGDPQGFFANESQMDLVAQKLGMDPVLFRKKNLMHDGDISPIGHKIPHIKSDEILEKAIEISGYRKPKGKFTGRGLALAQWQPLGGEGNALVTLDEKGEITVATAMVDQGAGTYTAMRQVAAETLQVPLSCVRVEILDTSRVGPDTGVGASRATRIFGNATYAAAVQVKESLLDVASEILGVAKERLVLTGDGAIGTDTSRRIAYGEIVEKMGSPIRRQGSYKNFDAGPEAAMCVQVAEVEVDSETGQVSLKQFTTAHSTGTVINPLMHQGQIDGGVVMGTGYALMEGITIDAGKVVTTHFGENKIPTIRDIPSLKTVVLEEPVGNGPFGAMSIGEPPLVPVAAAIANAVHDAIGVRIYDLPITAEKVLEGIRSQRSDVGGQKSRGANG
ncbi:MAG TPA: xanthine dehydrogenase family protein molybdopterin-binding subunit [Candidatus Acidoferrales bacterium]|nr:xanthine dehydrogenase family protein molybdopterin-binding subunit [Candidatus Acidoferrales bacterium]